MKSRTCTRAALAFCTLFAAARTAGAQSAPPAPAKWEFLLPSGAFVPTGAQRDIVKAASVTAAQISYVPRPTFAVTATFGWARSRDLGSVGDPKLDAFTYDVGAEVRAPRRLAGDSRTFTPFAGIGAGARSYDYRSLDVAATHNAAAYGAAGAELGMSRVRLRLELRDYLTGFKPLVGGGKSDARNDVLVMLGLRFTRHRA